MGMQLAPWIKNPGWATTWTLGQRSASIYFLDILRFGVTTWHHVLSKTSRFVDEFPIKIWISCQVWLPEGVWKLGVEVSRHASVLACSCRIFSGTICCLHVISTHKNLATAVLSTYVRSCAHVHTQFIFADGLAMTQMTFAPQCSFLWFFGVRFLDSPVQYAWTIDPTGLFVICLGLVAQPPTSCVCVSFPGTPLSLQSYG